jgi:flagellar basal-body rod protein FlgB
MFGDFIPFLNQVMDYSSVNGKVISNNISNYNTPGYKTQSLKFEDILNQQSGISLRTDNEKHISNSSTSSLDDISNMQTVVDDTGSSRVDGNNVDLTNEMVKMLQNNALMTTSVNAINKEFSLDKIAMG